MAINLVLLQIFKPDKLRNWRPFEVVARNPRWYFPPNFWASVAEKYFLYKIGVIAFNKRSFKLKLWVLFQLFLITLADL